MSTAIIPNFKIVITGDGGVGKTAVLTSYTANTISNDYTPTVFDTRNAMTTMENGKPVALCLYDTAGQEDYDRLRCLAYPQTDCFIVSFSLVGQTSFDNIASKWIPELRENCPDVPIVLVGTKLDLRTDVEMNNKEIIQQMERRGEVKVITTEQGQRLAQQIGAHSYVECSAITQENLHAVFRDCIAACSEYKAMKLKKSRKQQTCCEIM